MFVPRPKKKDVKMSWVYMQKSKEFKVSFGLILFFKSLEVYNFTM